MRSQVPETLIERDAELEVLPSLMTRATAGRGQLLVISGPVASGKTALLEVLADQAATSDAAILAASCSRAERDRPYGAIRQLLQTCPRAVAAPVLAALPPAGPPGSSEVGAGDADQALHEAISTAVLELASVRPVMIQVDDVDVADRASVDALLHLHRRLRFARILLAVTERTTARTTGSALRAAIDRRTTTTHLPLAPLSRAGVEELLAARIDPKTAGFLASVHHGISGGNPALLHALVDDHWSGVQRGVDPVRAGEDAVGAEYGHAVLACLHRFDATILDLARVVAVLDSATTDAVVSELVGMGVDDVEVARATLEESGLFDGPRLRHPAARRAVIDGMTSEERASWHLRVARVLHDRGADAGRIATHLVEAGGSDGEWGAGVLRLAARTDLEAGRRGLAIQRLELAARSTDDDDDRAEILLTLLRVQWSHNPAAAARYLSPLRVALAGGRLGYDQIVRLAAFMLWYGHGDEIGRLFTARMAASDPDGVVSARWTSTWHPGAVEEARSLSSRELVRRDSGHGVDDTAGPVVRATGLFGRVRAGAGQREVAEAADNLLAGPRVGDLDIEVLVVALTSLMATDQNDRVARWSERLLGEDAVRQAPTCAALLEAFRGEAALRLGDLHDAAALAEDAYGRLTPQAWGPAIAVPLATRVAAATGLGDHREAARLLRRPVPEGAFSTQVGLTFYQARARHLLSVGRPELALTDFNRCGELMVSWDVDLPGVVPWRVGAAEALIAVGRGDEARTMIDEHLGLPGADRPRVRGNALRVQAATVAPALRVGLLSEAVELLDEDVPSDRFELACALLDLSRAHHDRGESERARALARRAGQMSKGCASSPRRAEPASDRADGPARPAVSSLPGGAEGRETTGLPLPGPGPGKGEPGASGAADALSDAERRVAVLASLGHTNRDISGRLYVTVSTVEQHLTRVYRKLNLARRADLPAWLQRESLAAGG